ncbi:endonuclease/exonuclease/phosphatase family protein [Trueperella pyogenes]|uniref:endonuclease/exonuclease/phosphatase family protein n=1 Tax=Trueperella pyogenes TaxID=1661 RepID=UPI002169A095|nr:endonuclease/exonuclease/phosphatase family protein [Trueperella pyogenes]UVJ58040.1 endonuclease/exonuclease/phosphatase family protein [Trueperella pyogenes]
MNLTRTSVRLLTFNIQYAEPVPAKAQTRGAGRDSALYLAGQIAAMGADVVGLQEVDRGKWRSGRVDQLDLIAGAAGLTPIFAQTRRRYGMGLLTGLPIRRARVLRLPRRKTPFFREEHGSGWRFKWPDKRACLYALLDTDAGPIAVGVTHLSTVRPMARRQLHIALGGFDEFAPGVPALLIGDLNLRINHVEEELAVQDQADKPFAILHRGNGSPSWEPVIQIDHVLGRGFEAVRDDVVQLPVSDHAAVVVEIRATGSAGSQSAEAANLYD